MTIIQATVIKMMSNTGLLMILNFSTVIIGYLMSIFYYKQSQNIISTVGIFLIIYGVSKAILEK